MKTQSPEKAYSNAVSILSGRRKMNHRVCIAGHGCLVHAVNRQLTVHRKRIFKQFHDQMLEAAVKQGFLEHSKEWILLYSRAQHLACEWLAKHNSDHYSYQHKIK